MNENDAMKTITKEIRKAFPDFADVFIDERDKYLAVKLRNIARGRKYFFLGSNLFPPLPCYVGALRICLICCYVGSMPQKVVAVVGKAHVPGIVENWNSTDSIDVGELLR